MLYCVPHSSGGLICQTNRVQHLQIGSGGNNGEGEGGREIARDRDREGKMWPLVNNKGQTITGVRSAETGCKTHNPPNTEDFSWKHKTNTVAVDVMTTSWHEVKGLNWTDWTCSRDLENKLPLIRKAVWWNVIKITRTSPVAIICFWRTWMRIQKTEFYVVASLVKNGKDNIFKCQFSFKMLLLKTKHMIHPVELPHAEMKKRGPFLNAVCFTLFSASFSQQKILDRTKRRIIYLYKCSSFTI